MIKQSTLFNPVNPLNEFIVKNGKQLRYGVTTGSCAAAAAKAALLALLGTPVNRVRIMTPKGWSLDLEIVSCRAENGGMVCAVRKDAGDDPDITHGMLVEAHCVLLDTLGVEIDGGYGVGRVSKKGLSIAPGMAAINPIPRKMIAAEIEALLPEGRGARIEIRLPQGEELAQKTFNPRLGIIGGLSILGTTGIVEPMSDEAIKKSLALEVSMAAAAGHKRLILSPGNHGLAMISKLGLSAAHTAPRSLKIGNYLGYMLDQCLAHAMHEVLFIGHLSKLVRLSGGVFDSYSKVADARIEIIAAHLAWLGAPQALIRELFECVTTEGALDIIEQHGYNAVYERLCAKAEEKSMLRVFGKLRVGVLMFALDQRVLGCGSVATEFLQHERLQHQALGAHHE